MQRLEQAMRRFIQKGIGTPGSGRLVVQCTTGTAWRSARRAHLLVIERAPKTVQRVLRAR
jgi:hypothetical protein